MISHRSEQHNFVPDVFNLAGTSASLINARTCGRAIYILTHIKKATFTQSPVDVVKVGLNY